MEEIVKTFGINWKLLFIQAVNFGVLLFLLHRFLYRPLLKMMNERQEKIGKGVEDAKQAGIALADASAQKEEILGKSKEEAKEIVNRAVVGGEKMKEGIVKEADEKAKEIIMQAEKRAGEEKQKVIAEAKKELGAVVIASVEKILREKMSPEMEREFIAKSL